MCPDWKIIQARGIHNSTVDQEIILELIKFLDSKKPKKGWSKIKELFK